MLDFELQDKINPLHLWRTREDRLRHKGTTFGGEEKVKRRAAFGSEEKVERRAEQPSAGRDMND